MEWKRERRNVHLQFSVFFHSCFVYKHVSTYHAQEHIHLKKKTNNFVTCFVEIFFGLFVSLFFYRFSSCKIRLTDPLVNWVGVKQRIYLNSATTVTMTEDKMTVSYKYLLVKKCLTPTAQSSLLLYGHIELRIESSFHNVILKFWNLFARKKLYTKINTIWNKREFMC